MNSTRVCRSLIFIVRRQSIIPYALQRALVENLALLQTASDVWTHQINSIIDIEVFVSDGDSAQQQQQQQVG